MKRVTAHESLAYISHLKNVLDQSGIDCSVKNALLSGGLGDIPYLECLPELWVLNDDDLSRATQLITDLEKPSESTEQWKCSGCGELNEGQFAQCWRCGAAAPEGS
jgi:hypothetical protein